MKTTLAETFQRYFMTGVGIAALVGLYLTSLYNYLLFHSLAEIFSIVVAYGIFMIAWNSRKYIENDYLIFIAIAYLFIGGLDLLHTLAYKGMMIFPEYDYYANQLWIATRYMESLTLLAAFWFFYRKTHANAYWIFALYTGISALVILAIFTWKIFPVCFVEGRGLTPFKKVSEYIICSILIVDIWLLRTYRQRFDERVFKALVWSLIFTILSELAFTIYISNYGFSNLVGHYFKIFSFYLIYKAIIETGIVKPYDIIFRELVQKEQRLAEAKHAAEQAQRTAEIANQAKSEFLSNMSHELRTPLNGILGYAQILKRKALSLEQQEGLAVIERSGTHLLNLINEVLDLSKIEARKMEIHTAPLDLSEFLNGLAKIIQIRAYQKGIAFQARFARDLPARIVADEQRLTQVMLNLLGNAVKFTEHGLVRFEVTTVADGPEGEEAEDQFSLRQAQNRATVTLRFSISDTGIGIAPQDIENIFSPFKQVGEHKRKVEGTGLGLAISRKLVRLMGGALRVASSPGQGSTFWCDVPFSQAEEQHGLTMAQVTHKIIGYAGNRRRILVVDDRWENRMVLVKFLTSLGFEVFEAENGAQCLQQTRLIRPDLIFMDLVMPLMDGFEATRHLRTTPGLQNITIVAVSASTTRPAEAIVAENALDGFLVKPVQLSEVLDVLDAHLDLQWLYEENPFRKQAIPTNSGTDSPSGEWLVPPADEITALYDFACSGDIMGIRQRLKAIEMADPRYTEFVGTVREFARGFQIRQIREFLEQYLDPQ